MGLIARDEYLSWLLRWRDKHVIKVVSGVRRSGKSTLLRMYRDHLVEAGVSDGQIIEMNFEDLAFEDIADYRALYAYVCERLAPGATTYVFLDEVQHVDGFEKALDSLFVKEGIDIYVTGSNAYLMAGELATLLSGRYVELRMLPLSYKEFCSAETNQGAGSRELFEAYLVRGSFPFIAEYGLDEAQAAEYLRSLYNTILLKDVVQRMGVRDVGELENVTKFLLHNVGGRVSLRKIADTLTSGGARVDQRTVGRYVQGLTDSLLLYAAPRYNIKGRRLLTTNGKYYVVDVGFRRALVRGRESDAGRLLENVVYLELLRRGFTVYVGDVGNGEVDFVAMRGQEVEYFQVSATTLDDATLARELGPFRRLGDNYPKTLLTLDDVFSTMDYSGVKKRNVIDWLLE